MTLTKLLQELLKEPISGYKKEGKWYTVVRELQPHSTRFAFLICETLEGVKLKIFDRSNSETKTHDLANVNFDIKPEAFSTPPEKPIIDKKVTKLLEQGKIADANGYLKSHGLDKFLPVSEDVLWRTLKPKGKKPLILVPYTTFDLFPEYIGGQMYKGKGKGNKRYLKGVQAGNYQGSFHPHSFNKDNRLWILGEGFLESYLAGRVCEGANVLEVGGISKFRSVVLQIIDKHPEHKIIILGENSTKGRPEVHALVDKFDNVGVVYPPSGDDFADYFSENQDMQKIEKVSYRNKY